jgi:ABC-type dipeptide/oligopeptide/nickel transport system ATPase component
MSVPPRLLEVENLRTYFHTDGAVARAVDGVSFTVGAGETLAIVGESGSGKSVTSLSLMRLVPTRPGEIADGVVRFRGRDLLLLSEPTMRAVRGNESGMIFQEPMSSLNPLLTALDVTIQAQIPAPDPHAAGGGGHERAVHHA